MRKGKKINSIIRIIANVLLLVFLTISVFSVLVTILSKKDVDGAAEIFGYQMRIVTSESMAKCDATDVSNYDIGSIPVRSLVFIQLEPDDADKAEQWYADIKIGDVLTFKYTYNQQVVITHRVVDIEEKTGGGYVITLEGDNKDYDQNLLSQVIDTTQQSFSTDYVIGKVTAQSYLLGLLITMMQQPIGILLLVILPCIVIIALEVIRIVGVLNDDKKRKEQKEKDMKDEEIEELKRRLAELQNAGDTANANNNQSNIEDSAE